MQLQLHAFESRHVGSNYNYARICVFYRQIQLLAVVTNKCFQQQFLPIIMFCGASSLILLLYPLLAFGSELPTIFQVGFIAFVVIIGFVTTSFLISAVIQL